MDYYEKRDKDHIEEATLWFKICLVGTIVFVGVAVAKWIIALITAL